MYWALIVPAVRIVRCLKEFKNAGDSPIFIKSLDLRMLLYHQIIGRCIMLQRMLSNRLVPAPTSRVSSNCFVSAPTTRVSSRRCSRSNRSSLMATCQYLCVAADQTSRRDSGLCVNSVRTTLAPPAGYIIC